jgi:glycosyltransferase involved in cell wall biosynthesis
MNSQPCVSIVIPTYNREKWLDVSIGSVLRQTFQDWELILVDDHSTDRTPDAAESFMRQDSRIRYVMNERRRGPAGARNHGIGLARGRFVAFLDSDDEWEAFHLDRMVYYLDKYPDRIDIMTANPVRKKRNTGEIYQQKELNLADFKHSRIEDAYLIDPDALFERFYDSVITTQTMVVRREILDQFQFDEDLPPGPEDVYLHVNLAYHKKRIAHLQQCHVTYWSHADNLTMPEGDHDPRKLIRLYAAYTRANLKMVEDFPMSSALRRSFLEAVGDMYFWKMGYNGYLQLGDYRNARRYYLKALWISPFKIAYWKTFLASFGGQWFSPRLKPTVDVAPPGKASVNSQAVSIR